MLGIQTNLGDGFDHTQNTGPYLMVQFSVGVDFDLVLNVTESILSSDSDYCFGQYYFVSLSFYQSNIILSNQLAYQVKYVVCAVRNFHSASTLTGIVAEIIFFGVYKSLS